MYIIRLNNFIYKRIKNLYSSEYIINKNKIIINFIFNHIQLDEIMKKFHSGHGRRMCKWEKFDLGKQVMLAAALPSAC